MFGVRCKTINIIDVLYWVEVRAVAGQLNPHDPLLSHFILILIFEKYWIKLD